MRAKFRVQFVKELRSILSGQSEAKKYMEVVELYPVYSDDPNSENRKFWEATPSGMFSMNISNQQAWGWFKEGKEYLLDFTEAE